MNVSDKLALQSFCLRGFKDNATVAKMVRELGLTRIELCGVHVDFKQPGTFDDVIAAYRDAGVEIVSIGVNGVVGDQQGEAGYFDFLRRCGAKYMSVDFAPESFATAMGLADQRAAELAVRMGIHNHGGRHWLGNTQTLKWVLGQAPESIGLCLDTAWALHSHEDPIKMVETFAGRLYGVHFKDFTFDSSGKHKDVVVGTGNLDLAALAEALKKINFDGYYVLEYEGDVNDPMPALKQCVAKIAEMA
jgi:sugar phosphate isomerase/epimerase